MARFLTPSDQVARDNGQQCDNAEIYGTKDDDLVDDLLDEVGGGLAGTEARDEAAVGTSGCWQISTGSYWMVE